MLQVEDVWAQHATQPSAELDLSRTHTNQNISLTLGRQAGTLDIKGGLEATQRVTPLARTPNTLQCKLLSGRP